LALLFLFWSFDSLYGPVLVLSAQLDCYFRGSRPGSLPLPKSKIGLVACDSYPTTSLTHPPDDSAGFARLTPSPSHRSRLILTASSSGLSFDQHSDTASSIFPAHPPFSPFPVLLLPSFRTLQWGELRDRNVLFQAWSCI